MQSHRQHYERQRPRRQGEAACHAVAIDSPGSIRIAMDVLIHVANVLFLLSYLVRDILVLRLLTVVAILALLPYYFANGLYPPIFWNSVFIAINLYQLYRLVLERRPVRLSL